MSRSSPITLPQEFYEAHLITGIDHVVKSGKEATVYCCRAHPATGADFLAVAGGVWNHKDGPEAAVRAFNAGLPCGAVLLRTSKATQLGFTVATFRLVERPGQHCDGTGNQARTAFGVRGGKIRAWVRLSDRPQGGGSPAPQPGAPQPGGGGQAA